MTKQINGVATGRVSSLCFRLQYGNGEENRTRLKNRSRPERGTVQSVKHLLAYRKITLRVSSRHKWQDLRKFGFGSSKSNCYQRNSVYGIPYFLIYTEWYRKSHPSLRRCQLYTDCSVADCTNTHEEHNVWPPWTWQSVVSLALWKASEVSATCTLGDDRYCIWKP